MANNFALCVGYLDRDFFFVCRLRFQVVVEDRAFRRVVAHRALALNRIREMKPGGGGGLIEVKVIISDGGTGLSQGTNVVENPEGAAMRCCDEVVVLHSKV